MQNNVLNYLYDIVKEKPDKAAYCSDTDVLTFSDVYNRACKIGSFLAGRRIYKKPIIIFMKKSPQEITAFFGAVAGGNFYVPIDEEMPVGRIKLILDNVKSPLIICDDTTIEKARAFDIGNAEIVLYNDMMGCEIDEAALDKIHRSAIDTDPIYIVFTSGSTGIPKGVAACHRSVIDYIEQLSEVLELNGNTVFGNQSPLYFDACLKELYPTLKFGATTYLIPKSLFSFPTMLVEYLNEHKINTICWVASALTMVSALNTFDTVAPKFLHTIAFGSEVFPIKQYKKWRDVLPNARFINLYGPTECTGMCCYYKVDREFADTEIIPIGHPFDNREIILLTEEGRQIKKGEQGEICVRGTALTLGYYNDPERTRAAFVQNPLNISYPELIYKTGDIGRYNERGELCFVSRKDSQIKHMGHRIELGEIETNVNMLSGIRICACAYDTVKNRITLFYEGDMPEGELVQTMKGSLPRYMLPNKTVRLDKMPFTANGKIDRVKLKGMQ